MTPKQTEFCKILRNVDHSKREDELFYDFCETVTLTLRLPFYGEKVYEDMKRLRAKYDDNAIKEFDKCVNIMVDELTLSHQDFLGTVFMELDMGSKYKGQFFTPYHISALMAKMTIGEVATKLNDEQYFSCCDPACGAGAMLIAVIEAAKEEKLNPSTNIYIEAIDIDKLACLMCYIQLSLYGVAAKVIHGDSLAWKHFDSWYTPVYFLNNWEIRITLHDLREARKKSKAVEVSSKTLPPESNIRQDFTMVIPRASGAGQMSFGIEEKVAV